MLSVEQTLGGDRVAFVERVRQFLETEPRVRRLAPLPKQVPVTAPTTGYQDVRLVAMTTIGLPMLDHVVVDWQQYGPKLAQVALTFGATCLDNVSTIDDPALGRRRTHLEDVRRNITAAGLTPAVHSDAA
jgi:2-iminoacetate synthase ThiH